MKHYSFIVPSCPTSNILVHSSLDFHWTCLLPQPQPSSVFPNQHLSIMDESKSFLVGGCFSFLTYVVFRGRIPGIYTNFEDCKSQVYGFPESRFQPFDNPNDACSAWLNFCSHSSKNDISTESGGFYAFHCASQCSPVKGKNLLPIMNDSDGCQTPSVTTVILYHLTILSS